MKNEPKAFIRRHASVAGGTCPACGAARVDYESEYPSAVMPFASARVMYCTGCGLGFVPDFAETLADYYRRDYASKNRKDRGIAPDVYFSETHRETNVAVKRYFDRSTRQVRLLKSLGAQFGDVLDYGSGPGYFLHCSKARASYAFEPDEESRKYLDHLHATSFSRLDEIQANSFDVICASHSIEHLLPEDLNSTLRRLVQALKPGGRFLIEVPTGAHTYLHLEGSRQDPHTLFFTPQAISLAVQRAGGEILFQDAMARPTIPRRENPIYTPPDDAFFNADRGSLTVVCTARNS